MITVQDSLYTLSTKHTTYSFHVMSSGHLEHLYYGQRIDRGNIEAMKLKRAFEPGNVINYVPDHVLVLEDRRLEISSYGKGDIREPFIEVVYPDGSYTSDFCFDKAELSKQQPVMETLPQSYGADDHLVVTLKDRDLRLELHYSVYEECDVITRRAVLYNDGDHPVQLDRLMSTQLDFDDHNYVMETFTGSWANEMNRNEIPVYAGKIVNSSYTGTSSNRANPFVMIKRPNTQEDLGEVYGLNLVYSGNHYECCEVNSFGKMRFVSGINPQSFSFTVEPGSRFEAPEAVMSYSFMGLGGMSRNMHDFVNQHIVRGAYQNQIRPILINSWEANYFDINEFRILRLARAAKEAGINLFVMDDGWFGTRDDDKQSLGDWTVNTKKLPRGLSGICNRINAMGLQFGLWIEPEMVNVNSDLYRSHPDWVIQIPDRPHSEGRNQRILDLCNPDVVDYLENAIKTVLSSANISYVKWDMNRIFSDVYSRYLGKDRQKEVFHRYIMGLYDLMRRLTKAFENILFEGCASGGNRFDLGILCYFPQIWASDNTDAICRARMQENYSYGYPLSTFTAHVSNCPNHQTLRTTPLDTRFNIASYGVLGYECNLVDMSREDRKRIGEQVVLYKEWEDVFQYGDFYRIHTGGRHQWISVSKDKKRAVGMICQEMVTPNTQTELFYAKGLDPQKTYRFYNIPRTYNILQFGDLINTAAPIHIRQDGLVHKAVSKVVTMPSETEDYVLTGQQLMAGIHLKQAFSATGYDENVRFYQDFSSRMYLMEEIEQ